MNLYLNYGSAVTVIPRAAAEYIDRATKKELKILFFIASGEAEEKSDTQIASALGISEEEVAAAVAFWKKAGIIGDKDGKADEGKPMSDDTGAHILPRDERKRLLSSGELPRYTTEELTGILEKRAEYKKLIDECQQLFGKVFNTAEINTLIALTDYLGLESDYVLLLFAYCGKLEHKSLRTVEKLAQKFSDEGVTDAEALQIRLKELDETEKAEYQIRKIFGTSDRAFTKKEKALIHKWILEYKYEIEIIEKAYETTVDSTNKTSLPYAGAILDRWYAEGIRTLDDIEKDAENRKKSKKAKDGSFDTDEFLEAALKRSFPDKKS